MRPSRPTLLQMHRGRSGYWCSYSRTPSVMRQVLPGVSDFSLMAACKRNLFHTIMMQGAYMMTANPTRQMMAPMLSNRSGQELSTAHPQRSDSIVNMPP